MALGWSHGSKASDETIGGDPWSRSVFTVQFYQYLARSLDINLIEKKRKIQYQKDQTNLGHVLPPIDPSEVMK